MVEFSDEGAPSTGEVLNRNVKLIKHPPSRSLRELKPHILLISTTTPFVSALKHVGKLMKQQEKRNKKAVAYVEVIAMGRAIDKALAVATKLISDGHRVQVKTSSVNVLDEFIEIDSDGYEQVPQLKNRLASSITIKIWNRKQHLN